MKKVLLILVVFISVFSLNCKKDIKYGKINGIIQNLINSQVSFMDVGLKQNGKTVKTAHSDIDGNFSFPKVEVGDYQLAVTMNNTTYTDSTTVMEDVTTEKTLKIADKVDIWGFVYLPDPEKNLKKGPDPVLENIGAKDVLVELLLDSKVLQKTKTDLIGKYSLNDVVQGDYTLRFSGYNTSIKPVKSFYTITRSFTVNKNNVLVPSVKMTNFLKK